MSNLESASFELNVSAPSSKRPRYNHHTETEILQVEADPINEVGVNTVTITTDEVVPSSQFEIEINSQVDEGDVEEEITQLQNSDLGPNFSIVQDTQEIHTLNSNVLGTSDITSEDGSTLNAIGHALIQMQQGGQSTPSSIPQGSQLILTRTSSSSGTEAGQNTPLYVMIPPASSAEILHAIGQTRPIAPKSGMSPPGYGTEGMHPSMDVAANREAQRKATHNEVERRRRDRINELIKVLAQIVPACQKKDATTGSIVGYVYSKGTVLDKTVEYLKELVTQNEQLAASAKLAEKSAGALVILQNQISVLEKENTFLRAQIIQFGIDAAASSGQKQPGSQPLLTSPLAQSLLNTVATQSSPSTSASPPQPSSQQANSAAAQQLLLSLAQSLTNSPLLTSLSQNQQPTTLQSHVGVGSSMATPPTQAPSAYLTSSQLTSVSPIGQSSLTMSTGGSNANAPLLNSLVQTLTSMANTTTSPSTPLPKTSPVPPSSSSGGLSAAAAASLLNTLILAQNVLTNNTSGGSPVQGTSNDSISLETGSVEQSTQ